MDVAEGDIVKAARGELLLRNGVVGGVGPAAHLAVQHEDIAKPLALRHREAPQHGAAALFQKGRAAHPHTECGQRHAADLMLPEDADVPGQLEPGPGGFRRIIIVVSRGDEHRHAHPREAAGELLPGLVIAVVAVEQIAREQHELDLLLLGKLRKSPQKLPLLRPPEGGLVRGQALKGGVEMQVRRVEYFDGAHLRRTPSALRQRPVSVSISKTQPSSLLGPLPDS